MTKAWDAATLPKDPTIPRSDFQKDASVATLSKTIFGCLFGLATSSAAYAQDLSTVAKVSAGTAAITAAVVLLHGHSNASSASSTDGASLSSDGSANSFTGSDIGRGGNTSSASFAGYGNTPSINGGGSSGSGPLAPGGAAGVQTASTSSGSFDGSASSVFTLVYGPSPIITILTCATATLATTSTSISSTGTTP
jgi:hypothetical protein